MAAAAILKIAFLAITHQPIFHRYLSFDGMHGFFITSMMFGTTVHRPHTMRSIHADDQLFAYAMTTATCLLVALILNAVNYFCK